MPNPPRERIKAAARLSLPLVQVFQPPRRVPEQLWECSRPEHEMIQVLVEEKRPQRGQGHRDCSHSPERHARLQNQSAEPDPVSAQPRAHFGQILPKGPLDVVLDPTSAVRRKLRHHVKVEFRMKPGYDVDQRGIDIVRSGREDNLDVVAQNLETVRSMIGYPRRIHPRGNPNTDLAPACRMRSRLDSHTATKNRSFVRSRIRHGGGHRHRTTGKPSYA